MGYPQQQQYPPQAPPSGYQPDPWANGNVPAGSYDGADPFDNAMPDQRAPRAMLAGPDGRPYMHQGEPVPVSPPSLRTLGVGRLVFIVPKKMERGIKSTFEGAWKPVFDRLTADVIVCDGTGERFGGDPTKGIPDLLGPFPVPCVIEDMWIDKDGIIERVPETLIGGGFKIGRIAKVQTKAKRTAWNFNAPHEDPEQARAIVQSLRPLWAAYCNRQLPILSIETLGERYGVKNAPMPVAQPSPYVQQMPQNAPAQLGMVATPTGPVQQQPSQPQWPVIPPGQNMAPVAPVSAPVAPVADWTLGEAPPAGFEGVWGSWTPGQREQVLASMGRFNPNAQAVPAVAPGAGAYAQGPGY
jgi:hypothetical protein